MRELPLNDAEARELARWLAPAAALDFREAAPVDDSRPPVMWSGWREEDGSTPLPAAVDANRAQLAAHLREPVRLP